MHSAGEPFSSSQNSPRQREGMITIGLSELGQDQIINEGYVKCGQGAIMRDTVLVTMESIRSMYRVGVLMCAMLPKSKACDISLSLHRLRGILHAVYM